MSTPVVSVAPDTRVIDAVRLLLETNRRGLPVIDKAGELVGIISEGDFHHRAELGTDRPDDAVAVLVGIEGGVVSGVINLESSGVEASDWRPRHDEQYHEACFFAARGRDGC